ncbi:hypothetical protein KR51_00018670 [Rubidibacter lacunae KORDI 51-2]|uniref:Sulfotransferase family n=1 Tax=Rubidibacter lacunae KORDI 51-2 TaxID=582515 RepID=U5DM37_9CHRO|nr:sulfotransferase family 2 domain-containing protein [Rubidibacter lacunae]ERN41639.1 hypothetical protein KR51_00018670 [Rubidibacter lacunae KORDI 51-2]
MTIVSHEHEFIFLKTAKTAGTSIAIALSQYCGPNDILARVSTPDEAIRKQLGYSPAQNYAIPLSHYAPKDWARLLLTGRRSQTQYFHPHMSATEIREKLGSKCWNRYYKFCFDRNPWDKAISLYHRYWRRPRDVPQPSLHDFYSNFENARKGLSNYWIYSIDGNVVVDYVARYEDLQGELTRLGERLGIPGKIDISKVKAKSSSRTDKRQYREALEPSTRDLIATICHKEIAFLGYEF